MIETDFHYDNNDATRFFWEKTQGNFIECTVVESLNSCKKYIKIEKVFRDYREELAELVVT